MPVSAMSLRFCARGNHRARCDDLLCSNNGLPLLAEGGVAGGQRGRGSHLRAYKNAHDALLETDLHGCTHKVEMLVELCLLACTRAVACSEITVKSGQRENRPRPSTPLQTHARLAHHFGDLCCASRLLVPVCACRVPECFRQWVTCRQ